MPRKNYAHLIDIGADVSHVSREPLLAVLIDADNIPATHANCIMAEIANFGNAALRRVYGDWSSSNVSPWREKIRSLGLTAVQPISGSSSTLWISSTPLRIIIQDSIHSS